jgi:TBC1 domain family member 14
LGAGTFPPSILELMEEDIQTTLPSLKIFNRDTGPMYPDLKDMLCAWVVARSDEGLGYTFGAAKIAAMLLLNMAQSPAFIVMRNLLERHCLRSMFAGDSAKHDVSISRFYI